MSGGSEGPALRTLWEKFFPHRREGVDEHHFLFQHGRAVFDIRREIEHIARRDDALFAGDDVADTAALDHRDLLVRVRMHRRDDAGADAEAAHHQLLAPDHLPLDALGDFFGFDAFPVRRDHFFPLSSPEPVAAKSGCTFTTPNNRSSSSRFAAMNQRKLIAPPGAATFGW